jgi:hypothetical protein
LKSVPFDVSRKTLYNAAEIYEGFNLEQPESFDNCFDTQVYRHYMSKGKITSDVKESVARMLHDHGMLIGIGEYFRIHNYLQFVGVMGGHALLRTDEMYLSFGFSSPMIFLGSKFWREEVPVYPLLKGLTATGKYKNLYLTLTDDFEEIMQILIDFQELTKAHPEDFSLR